MSTKAAEVGAAPPLTAFRLPGRDGKMTALLSVPGDVPAVVLWRATPASPSTLGRSPIPSAGSSTT